MRPEGGLDLTLYDLIPARPLWMAEGTCRQHPEVTWFPALCAVCPVVGACEDYALADPDLDGVWAGTTGRERRALRRKAS